MPEAQGIFRNVWDQQAHALRVTGLADSIVLYGTLAAIPDETTVQNHALYIAHDDDSLWVNLDGTWTEVTII